MWAPPPASYPHILLVLLAAQYSFEAILSLLQLTRLHHSPSSPPFKLRRFLNLLDEVRVADAASQSKNVAAKGGDKDGAKEGKEEEVLDARQTFEKSQNYARDKIYFSLFSSTLSLLLNVLLLFPVKQFNHLPLFTHLYLNPYLTIAPSLLKPFQWIRLLPPASNPVHFEIVKTLSFLLCLLPLTTVISLPLSYLKTFHLEEKHGFNKSTRKLWIVDEIKSFGLTLAFGAPLVIAGVRVMRWAWGEGGREAWWVGGTEGGIIAIQLLFLILYPVVIAPMFNKFTPLPADSPLTTQLSALAKRVDFPLGKIWVCDSSKRSSHSNAFFYGVPFLTKHIVLFDTLIEKNSTEEVLAVLGHELGHFKKGHNISLLLSTDTYVLFLLVLFTTSVQSPAIFSSFGFPSPSATSPYPILLGFILAQDVFGPLDCLAQFVMHSLSRRFEYQADEFAKNLGYAEQLKRGLVRIGADNMGVTDCHKLWSAYHHSHPTLGERIERLDDSDDKKKE